MSTIQTRAKGYNLSPTMLQVRWVDNDPVCVCVKEFSVQFNGRRLGRLVRLGPVVPRAAPVWEKRVKS